MKESVLIKLLFKKFSSRLNQSEKETLRIWESDTNHPKNKTEIDLFAKIWEDSEGYKTTHSPDVEKGLNSLMSRIENSKKESRVRTLRRRTIRWVGAAASIALLIALSFFGNTLYNSNKNPLVFQTGEEEQLEINLPDGSSVHLNENSELTFTQKESLRAVELSGEAWFDVKKKSGQSFIVEAENGIVEVLGTAFNVRTIPEEHFVEVAVERGVVKLKGLTDALVLKAGEKGTAFEEGKVLKGEDTFLNANSWRTQELKFRNNSLSEIINAIERHYEIKCNTRKLKSADCPYTTNFSNEQLDTVFEILETAFGLNIEKINPNQYKFSGGKTCD